MAGRLRSLVLAAIVAAPLAGAAAQRSEQTAEFKWSDAIAAGRWVRANNINGKITIGQASGNHIEVTAVKRWRRGNPDDVRLVMKKDGEDAVICALWGRQTDCDERSSSRRRSRWDDRDDNYDNDVSVDFTILVPKGVKIEAGSVNGGIAVTGATADADVSTVNGNVRVETGTGPLRVSAVNGTVNVRVTGESVNTPMSFSTVNGSVYAELPPNFGADVTMTTVNGSLESDFELTLRGRINPHHMSVHVGAPGGPQITLTTVNGNVELRKR